MVGAPMRGTRKEGGEVPASCSGENNQHCQAMHTICIQNQTENLFCAPTIMSFQDNFVVIPPCALCECT